MYDDDTGAFPFAFKEEGRRRFLLMTCSVGIFSLFLFPRALRFCE